MEIPDDLVAALQAAHCVVAITGAGVSAESGIPTFRGAREGLWAKYDPMQLATPEAFTNDPETVTRWYDWRRGKCLAARPNPAHLALARLEEVLEARGREFALVTQNVDRLHQAAGSRRVIELHGTLWVWRCTVCSHESEDRSVPFAEYPTKCPCGGIRRPGVVWFGEALPQGALEAASAAAGSCDIFMSLGTSSVVYPAAGLAHVARARGARVLEVNAEPTPLSPLVTWSLRGMCGEILPVLAERACSTSVH
jgi:NAD-dependent deacetylase